MEQLPEIDSPVRAFSSEVKYTGRNEWRSGNGPRAFASDCGVGRVRRDQEFFSHVEPVSDSIVAVDLFHLCTNERDKCEENSERLRTGNVDRSNVLIKRLERASENAQCHTLS